MFGQLMAGLLAGSLTILSVFLITTRRTVTEYQDRKATQKDISTHRQHILRLNRAFNASIATAILSAAYLVLAPFINNIWSTTILAVSAILSFIYQLYGLTTAFNYLTNDIIDNASGDEGRD